MDTAELYNDNNDNNDSDNEDIINDSDNEDNDIILKEKKYDAADIEGDEEEEEDEKEDDEEEVGDVDIEDEVGDDDYYDDSGSEAAGPDSDSENDDEPSQKKKSSSNIDKSKKNVSVSLNDYDDDDDDDDDDDENYLQKFDIDINKNYILDNHPECLHHNYDEITSLSKVVRDKDNIIIDPLHKTIPFLTKYERARILGQRAKQIESGAKPLVKVPDNIIDGYIIAELELREKKIPFVIKRPLPDGSCEYWNVKDLEQIIY